MPVFAMGCPVCDATFDLERPEAPAAEATPPHAWVRHGKAALVKCLGEGNKLVLVR